jgi:hypothetical protein
MALVDCMALVVHGLISLSKDIKMGLPNLIPLLLYCRVSAVVRIETALVISISA